MFYGNLNILLIDRTGEDAQLLHKMFREEPRVTCNLNCMDNFPTGPSRLFHSVRYAVEQKRTEEELKEYHDKFEKSVKDRTREPGKSHGFLKESEQRLSEIIDFLPDATFAINTEGTVIIWNRAIEEMTGLSAEHMVGKGNYDYALPFYGRKRPILIDLVLESDEVTEKKYRVIRRNDGLLIAETDLPCVNDQSLFLWGKASRIFDYDGKLIGAVESIRDITERKMMEGELRDSEERLRILFEYAPDGYYLNDLKGNFIDGNKVAEEITGYKREELIGNNFLKLSLLSPKEISKAAALLAKSIMMKPTGPDEFNLKRKNGSQVPVEISTYPVKIKGKTHVLGIARDISERKRTEQELRENESRFRALVEQSLVGIYIFSKEQFIYVNEAFARIFGYRPDELISRLGHEALTHPEDVAGAREQVRKRLKNKAKSAHYIFRGLRKDGSVIFCEVFGRKIKLEDESVIIGSLVDITKRINAEKALTKREQELEIKSQSLEDSNIALNVLLKKRENDKIELQEDILSNVEELIMPFIEKLKICHLSSDQCMYANIIETNMKNLVSPFLRTLSMQYAKFTPKEIQVAGLVKDGKTGKEIADLLHMSIRAVEFHRDNIRNKLGLKGKKVNLRTYLLSLEGNNLP